MKWKKCSKKITLLMLCVFSAMFLCAEGKKLPELLDDRKLINLDKAIEFAKPGADSFFQAETTTAATAIVTTKPVVKEKNIRISIKSEIITYDGKECKYSELEEKLRKDNSKNTVFQLVDDYAETHIYKKVLNMLKNLHDEIGLTYTIK